MNFWSADTAGNTDLIFLESAVSCHRPEGFPDEFELACDVLRRAFAEGIVGPDADPENRYVLDCMMWLQDKNSHIQDPNWLDVWQSSQSLRYTDNDLPAFLHETTTDYLAVELARIGVPIGSVGFCTAIEQVLFDAQGLFYPSNISHWGSPHFINTDVSNIRWYLTLSNFNGEIPARFALSSTVPILPEHLPGRLHPDLAQINALWFPANLQHNSKFRLFIPSGRMLRFFALTPPTVDYQWYFGGRLQAQIQSTFADETVRNARRL